MTGPRALLTRRFEYSTANLVGHMIFVYGGHGNRSARTCLFVYNTQSRHWDYVDPAPGEKFVARSNHTSVLVEDKLLIYGGTLYSMLDLLEVDLVLRTCNVVECRGNPPASADGHSCCYLPKQSNLLVYSSRSDSPGKAVFRCHLPSKEWRNVKTKGQPPSPRCRQGSVLLHGYWFLYGGETTGTFQRFLNDLFILDTRQETPAWSSPGEPGLQPTSSGPITHFRGRLLVYKFFDPLAKVSLWTYDYKTSIGYPYYRERRESNRQSRNTVIGNFPPGRLGAMMVSNNEQVFVLGGKWVTLDDMHVLEAA